MKITGLKIKNRLIKILLLAILFIVIMFIYFMISNTHIEWWQYASLFIIFVLINYFFTD